MLSLGAATFVARTFWLPTPSPVILRLAVALFTPGNKTAGSRYRQQSEEHPLETGYVFGRGAECLARLCDRETRETHVVGSARCIWRCFSGGTLPLRRRRILADVSAQLVKAIVEGRVCTLCVEARA